MMTNLTIAIPSKGRMQEECGSFLNQTGFAVDRIGGSRGYQGKLSEFEDVEIVFLSPLEIASELNAGKVHLGITGLDLIRENTTKEDSIVEFLPLNFSNADVVIAIPEAWIDVATIEDLSDVVTDYQNKHDRRIRVATKYVNLTNEFLIDNGITEYEIVDSAGATEGAPAKGSADFIVDITSSGSTLQANNLKVPSNGTILKSQACLAVSLESKWNDKVLKIMQPVLNRIVSKKVSEVLQEINCDLPLKKVEKIIEKFKELEGNEAFFSENISIKNAPYTSFIINEKFSAKFATFLKEKGASLIFIKKFDYLYFGYVEFEINQLKERISQKIQHSKS